MKKRILSVLCAAALLLSLLPAAALAAEETAGFADIQNHWAKTCIEQAVQLQVLRGVSDTAFAPDEGMTRAMFVTAAGRLAARHGVQTEGAPDAGFADVPPTAWYAPYVSWAAAGGVVTGVSETVFDGSGAVTREQMCAMIGRLLTLLQRLPAAGADGARTFTDAAEISAYAADAVALMAQLEIVCGYPDGSFAPKAPVTRAEAAKVLCALEAYLSRPGTDTQPGTKPDEGGTAQSGGSGGGSGSGGKLTTYTVTFLSNTEDGAVSGMPAAQQVRSGRRAAEPAAPTRTGFVFVAWCGADGAAFDFESRITADTTLTAAWKAVVPGGNGEEALLEQREDAYRLDETTDAVYYPNLLDVFPAGELTAEKAQALAGAVGGTVAGQLTGELPFLQLLVPAEDYAGLQALADVLLAREDVIYACCDIPVLLTADAADSNPWQDWDGTPNTDRGNEADPGGTDWWAEAIHAYTGWEYAQYASPVKVGVIDAGVEETHADLGGVVRFLPQYPDNWLELGNMSHGTHVAGIIAAQNNDIGIRGVADFLGPGDLICADFNFKRDGKEQDLLSTGAYLLITKSMLTAGVKVINCSFGCFTQSEREYLKAASDGDLLVRLALKHDRAYDSYLQMRNTYIAATGEVAAAALCSLLEHGRTSFLVVQSAGNGYDGAYQDGIEAVRNGFFASVTPSAVSRVLRDRDSQLRFGDFIGHILIVGGVDNKRYTENGTTCYTMSTGSNYGPYVTLCAPGADILSLKADGRSGYTSDSGTSMSAPMVTGAAALVWGIDPSLTAGEVRSLLINQTNTRAKGVRENEAMTYPMLDVGMAARAAYEGRETQPESGTVTLAFYDQSTRKPIPVSAIFYDDSWLSLSNMDAGEIIISGRFCQAGEPGCFEVGEDGCSLVFRGVTPGEIGFAFQGYTRDYLLTDSAAQLVLPILTVPAEHGVTAAVYLEPLRIVVGDVPVTRENAADILGDGTASYDFDRNILTLANANITAVQPIYTNDDLNLQLPAGTTSCLTLAEGGTAVISSANSDIIAVEAPDTAGRPKLILAGNGEDESWGVRSTGYSLFVSGIALEIGGVTHALESAWDISVLSGSRVTCTADAGRVVSAREIQFYRDMEFIISSSLTAPAADPMLLYVDDILDDGWDEACPPYVETQLGEKDLLLKDSIVKQDGKSLLRCGDGVTYPTYLRIYTRSGEETTT